jgi:hypothetical protein
MAYANIEGTIAKVARAAEHYRVLKFELNGGFDYTFRPVEMKCEREGTEYRFYVGDIEPINPDFSLIAGDAYHNLRSALDHLVFQMHVRNARGNITAAAESDSMFPIYDHRRFKDKKKTVAKPPEEWSNICRLSAKERTAIEWLQPYRRGYVIPSTGRISLVQQMRQTLHDDNWFDIVDKHRTLHAVQEGRFSVHGPRFTDQYGFRQWRRVDGPLESHAEVDRWTFRRPLPPEKMQMHAGIYTTIGVDKPSDKGVLILPNLGGSILGVSFVIQRFARLFPRVENPLDISWIHADYQPPPKAETLQGLL